VEHQENFQKWFRDGSFKVVTDITEGIDNTAEDLVNVLERRNFGKAVLNCETRI
jgi:NADPH-dependent curcumin reductase CurA